MNAAKPSLPEIAMPGLRRKPSIWLRILKAAVATAALATVLIALPGSLREQPAVASDPPEEQQQVRRLPVEVVFIAPVNELQVARRYTGMIAARRSSELGFERSAKVMEILVDEGDQVSAGQPLARLDTRQLLVEKRRLQAQRQQAAAVLAELEAGPREQTIAAAAATVDDLVAQVELQQRILNRSRELVKEYVTSRENYDQAELGLQSIEARLTAARNELDELQAGTRVEQVVAQAAAVEQLDQQLADLEIEVSDSELTAPFAGRVSVRFIDEGAVITPAQPVLRIVESGHLEVRIGLPIDTVAAMSVGDRFEVQVEQQTWSAGLDRLIPEVDRETRTRLVILNLEPAAAEQVVPGQIARISVRRSMPTNGFWLPTAALVRSVRGLWAAYVAEIIEGDSTGLAVVRRRDVEVLHTEGDRTLVRGTLRPGDAVIISGTHRVVPDQIVAIRSGEVQGDQRSSARETFPNAAIRQGDRLRRDNDQ